MQNQSKKLLLALILGVMISCFPSAVLAADFNINILRQDGATCGELWVNDKLIWRVAVLSDDAKPVTGGFAGANTTFIVPDIVHGMFLLRVK